MYRDWFASSWVVVFLASSFIRAAEPNPFETAIAPLLSRRCATCHNPSDPKGKLDLTTASGLRRGGKSGAAVVHGKPEESYLVERVAEGSMPPRGKGMPLSANEVEQLRTWIRSGATWPTGRVLSAMEFTTDSRAGLDWWSLQPVARPVPPPTRNGEASRNPIDAFIVAGLEQHGLHLAPPARPLDLLRRVQFDLLGLPATPGEIDAFLADLSPNAYERWIDRLLASPHYGERWGRHWLDVVRFGESDGFEHDKLRDHAWRYRDYVVRSFNESKPYAQFIREQLAGDVVAPVTRDGIAATGFLVAGPWDEVQNVGVSKVERLRTREEQLEELVGAVGQAFLGLTVHCARCHDHKFDPIPQTDYYHLKAVFDGVDHGNRPLLTPGEKAEYDRATAPARDRIRASKAALEELKKKVAAATGPAQADLKRQQDMANQAIQQQEADLNRMHPIALAYSGQRRQPEPTVVFLRGDVRQPGPRAEPRGLSAARSVPAHLGLNETTPEAQRRLRFAEWVTHPDHPLTARVLVNRVWQYHFGQGLVATPSDFGFNGGLPSHPELLDWLAREFMAGGGDIKKLHRLILTSATYRQSARFDPRAAGIDADNRLLWRFSPRRLEAEIVRDAMLAVSGELNPQLGGPSFRPFTVTVFNTHFYHLFDKGTPEFNRRTVYRINVNTGKSPLLDALDCPAPSIASPKRRHTTTPLQALSLMNDSFVQRQAERFANRVTLATGADRSAQVALAYRLALGRLPDAHEARAGTELARQHGLIPLCWALLNASEFLYVR